jgi:hypothetical protein
MDIIYTVLEDRFHHLIHISSLLLTDGHPKYLASQTEVTTLFELGKTCDLPVACS